MTTQEIDGFFADTLLGDYDDDAPWAAVRAMHHDGNREIFEKAVAWLRSVESLKRARGADILCQLRSAETPSREPIYALESATLIADTTETETDEQALSSQLYALGHLRQTGSASTLIRYAVSQNADIRYAIAWALSSFHGEREAIAALIKLSDDLDEDVRDYALFALGVLGDLDTPTLRELFASHLDDPCSDAREEAIAALAKRRDPRAALPLLRLMRSGSYYIHHEDCFENLVEEKRRGADMWGTEDFIDVLYQRFPELLPPRAESTNN